MEAIQVLKEKCPACQSLLILDIEGINLNQLDESEAIQGMCPACQAEIIYTIENDEIKASVLNPSPEQAKSKIFSIFSFLKGEQKLSDLRVSILNRPEKQEEKKGFFSNLITNEGFKENE